MRRCRARVVAVRTKSRALAAGSRAAEAGEAAKHRATCLLDRVHVRLIAENELFASERREFQGADQFIATVAKDAEHVDDLAVEVVVDLGVAARLAQQYRGPPPKWLDIDAMRREEPKNPRRELPFAAVVSNRGTSYRHASHPRT